MTKDWCYWGQKIQVPQAKELPQVWWHIFRLGWHVHSYKDGSYEGVIKKSYFGGCWQTCTDLVTGRSQGISNVSAVLCYNNVFTKVGKASLFYFQ